jgi:SAM-dependent methyltransferase
MDPYEQNRVAWNAAVASGNRWTTPVSSDEIAAARQGTWSVLLTPTTPVPRAWFGDLSSSRVLGLASGGGQQCPIFAAAGARVTSLDASDAQLAQDRLVAERDGLVIDTVQGDMRDLSRFDDASFDLVFNPCSTCFVDDVERVWREVARVLAPGGVLLTGFTNPWVYLFDAARFDRGELVVVNTLPHTEELDGMIEFSHTFTAQLGGQMRAGLVVTDLYEDTWDDMWKVMAGRATCFMATRAVKPREGALQADA